MPILGPDRFIYKLSAILFSLISAFMSIASRTSLRNFCAALLSSSVAGNPCSLTIIGLASLVVLGLNSSFTVTNSFKVTLTFATLVPISPKIPLLGCSKTTISTCSFVAFNSFKASSTASSIVFALFSIYFIGHYASFFTGLFFNITYC